MSYVDHMFVFLLTKNIIQTLYESKMLNYFNVSSNVLWKRYVTYNTCIINIMIHVLMCKLFVLYFSLFEDMKSVANTTEHDVFCMFQAGRGYDPLEVAATIHVLFPFPFKRWNKTKLNSTKLHRHLDPKWSKLKPLNPSWLFWTHPVSSLWNVSVHPGFHREAVCGVTVWW